MIVYTDRQRQEAAEWFMDIHDADDPSPELLQRWTRWLEDSEGNRLAFHAVERAWHEIPDELEFVAPRAIWKPLAYAAMFVLTATAAWWVFERDSRDPYPASGEFTTHTGEHMNLTLADGSNITLGARSHVAVGFSAHSRDIRLDRGEAFFQVHKDPARPFNVHTPGGVITAVGTAFNVRASGKWLTVAVTEGAVKVESTAEQGSPRRLNPGQQLTVETASAHSMAVTTLTSIDPAQPSRWRDGWLVYRDQPLRAVIEDVARYTDRRISVAGAVDPALRFTGAVYRDSVVEWVEALPDAFPVTVASSSEEIQVK